MSKVYIEGKIPGEDMPKYSLRERNCVVALISSDDASEILSFRKRADKIYEYWIGRKKYSLDEFIVEVSNI